jgi:hypothetical protein
MKRGGKAADGNRFATLSQRSSEARNWEESDECDTDNVIEVMAMAELIDFLILGSSSYDSRYAGERSIEHVADACWN